LLIEIDDSRVAVEQAEKSRKAIELELHAAADHANELSASSSALNGLKRKLESDITALRAEVEETRAELRNSEQRVKTAANDAVRISEELRAEQVDKN
jgi:chromosome segregation ATPase